MALNLITCPKPIARRTFLQSATIPIVSNWVRPAIGQMPGDDIEIVNPNGRVPLSFVIDDSTCLVNMGHFCMPQFAEAWPDRKIYRQPWQSWPREIPDTFVREFGEWCAEHGVKGKYSVVPFPACVGWLDRGLPGWSRMELEASLKLVRELMVPNWDIHPEMISHTRVIDLKTGRPLESANSSTMENSFPQQDISIDYLASYLAYALRILKNCGLPCEGITTPGGFGNRVKSKLPIAVGQAVRDVFGTEVPHYFKYISEGQESTRPKLEFANDRQALDELTINVPAGTGDWFGGWEGTQLSRGDRYANQDATRGRMVDLIARGEPAVMLCHWPGMYCNGSKQGYHDFQQVVLALANRFGDQTIWMKLSDIGRYEAARQLVSLTRKSPTLIEVNSPLDCANFTIELPYQLTGQVLLKKDGVRTLLPKVAARKSLAASSYYVGAAKSLISFNLRQGTSEISY